MHKTLLALLTAVFASLALTACDSSNNVASSANTSQTPNILFVIMDDVGIDQMASFGYGGLKPPSMPNMDTIAASGVRFRNTWSMPECSPGRAAFFLGRYPHRTNIYQAIGPRDLANSQVSPYDTTAPKLLKKANYESAMFGKFHLAGPENNEAGNATPSVLGWDHFYGWIGGLPSSIDTTAGGIAPADTYSCGFVPNNTVAGGADTGACYKPDNTCSVITSKSRLEDAAGLKCLDSGGIFEPNQICGVPPAGLNFTRENGYYVSPLVIINGKNVEEVPRTDPRSRGYRTRIETDAAIAWINTRTPNKPWMATVSYSAAHTPWQQPPSELLGGLEWPADSWDCKATVAGRFIQDKMTEAMDTEFGRLLVETGLARRGDDGRLLYDPKATNTVIVIVGDNGSLGTAVKEPFQQDQAKGTAYQTGVWDPLIIAGPQVVEPNREVDNMVNTVDLFQFFGELAGLDVHKEVPRTVDSVGILPYLTNSGQASLRTINFTIGGFNLQANGGRNAACLINDSCTQIPISKAVCEDNQGIWWGPGYTDTSVIDNGGKGYAMCYEVSQARYKKNGLPLLTILPETSMAIRNDRFKLVRNITQTYDPLEDEGGSVTTEELYEVNQVAPKPLLDVPDNNLLKAPTPETLRIYDDLKAKLDDMLASEPYCPGDGNMDRVVDGEDLTNWGRIANSWRESSVYDFIVGGVRDGLTNAADANVIQNNLHKPCGRSYGLY